MNLKPVFGNPEKPLVSVCVFNFNYGRYLRECLDSVFSQTYSNIEINFSDNNSTDDSWEIALEYSKKYPGVMNITRNRQNFGPDANFKNCWVNVRGKYLIELCSDDALHPDYVKTCVNLLEEFPMAGFAMVHRKIINENGNRVEEPPFYNKTCLIPGVKQAAVYMMAAVNPSVSQIMYKKQNTYDKSVVGGITSRWYGTRLLDFNMCCEYPMIYIKKPLLYHRLHPNNDSYRAASNLMEVIGPYVLNHQFAEIAEAHGYDEVVERLPRSLDKLGTLSLRYCIRALLHDDEKTAKQYFYLSLAISPSVIQNPIYQKLNLYWNESRDGRERILQEFKEVDNLVTRSVSYDPPDGYLPLNV